MRTFASVLTAVLLLVSGSAYAGVPFTNLQGAGGVAFNPLAYPAQAGKEPLISDPVSFSKPQFGGWYVNLHEVNVDWTTFGAAETIGGRVELSYGYETIAIAKADTLHKNNFGAKVLLVPENAWGTDFVPAVSVGTIWKHISDAADGTDTSSPDFYAVATKLVKELPRPVLVSAGVLSTREQVTGVFGFNEDRDITGFGNVDLLITDTIALGFEYKQGARFDTFRNANYWDAHVGWLANDNLSLIAAYVNAGDHDSTSAVGLGDGWVLSAQYAF